MPEQPMTLQEWKDKEYLPWKKALADYHAARAQQMQRFSQNIGGLQTIVALLLEGKTRQALLAWNSLQLHPKLADIRVGSDGETVTLVETAGEVRMLKLDDVIADLERLAGREEEASPLPDRAGGS